MIQRLILGEPNRLVHLAKKQRLGNGAILLFSGLEDNEVALRLGENQPRDVEQGIGASCVLDLAGQRFDAVFLRLESHVEFQRRARWRIVPAKASLFVERPLAVMFFKFWTLATVAAATRPATPVAIAFMIPGATPLEIAAAIVVALTRGAVTPVAASTRTGSLFAGIVGERFCVIRFLRPSGEKLQIQIQLLERISVFGFTHCGWISVISGWLRLMTGERM